MDGIKLFKACFSLAENLMWERDTAPLETLPKQMEELSAMTDNFVRLAKKNFYQIEALPNAEAILVAAINYLKTQAIPPLRGNYEWFDYSLAILLELANPNSGVDHSGLPFLLTARNGIDQLIDWTKNIRPRNRFAQQLFVLFKPQL